MWWCSRRGSGVYWRVCRGSVIMGIISSCWRGSILFFVYSLCVLTIMMVLFGSVCCAIQAHLMIFGMRLMLVMWAYPRLNHCVLKAGPKEPKTLSLLCGK